MHTHQRRHFLIRLVASCLLGSLQISCFRTTRREGCPSERIIIDLEVAKTCGAGLEQDAKEGETTFILDSGASYHLVGNFSILSSFTAFAAGAAAPTYLARDGRRLAVAGVGTISWGSFHLSDVLYVPGLPAGVVLVSVTQLAERGYLVMFGGGRCHVKEQITGELVGNGRLHSENGVYQLQFLKIPPDTTDTTAPDTLRQHASTI